MHSTRTGGFFRCNRWQDDDDLDEYVDRQALIEGSDQHQGSHVQSARFARRKAKEMTRFIHHYSRWTAHRESAILERRMSTSAVTRLSPVVMAAKQCNSDDLEMGDNGKLCGMNVAVESL
ncbi:MAG: hypothetical protein ACREOZ_03845 [Gloeomargaritales cyanobacterium]